MTLQTKDLLFYNKEGNPMNLQFDENLEAWNGKIFFDKNSTETYKTQGIYLFEKVPGTNETFQAYLDKLQVFNTNGFKTYPKYDATELIITNIERVNENATYNTKWIYADNIESSYYPGMWCYFENLDSFHNNDFDTNNTELQLRKILGVEKGRILIWTETANDTALPTYVSTTGKIIPANIIEVQQALTGLPTEPTWTDTNINSKLYDDKKISFVTQSENTGIYTINDVCNSYTRDFVKLSPTLYTPSTGDKLQINIELKTSNILISKGNTVFSSGGSNFIQLPYIPSFLKVGDLIQPKAIFTTLLLSNNVQFTIVNIDRTTNTIEVSGSTSPQTVDCDIYLATNIFTIEQDIVLDNNNTYSLPLTYWTIVNKYQQELLNLSGGHKLEYIPDTDELHIISEYTNDYTNVVVNSVDVSGNITNYPISVYQYTLYPVYVKETLLVEETIIPDATIYNRNIIFDFIDNFGLNIRINGIEYAVDFDTDIDNTIGDLISQFSTKLATIGIVITQTTTVVTGDTLNITCDYPNIPIFTELNLGDQTSYYVKYRDIQFNNIKTQLLITINDNNYIVPFDTDDSTTVSNWVSTYVDTLDTLNILVSNTGNTLHFNLLDTEKKLKVTYNIGYIPKSGDLSIYDTLYGTNNNGSILVANEIKCNLGVYNFLNYYSTGQKITISGAAKIPQNKSYNIIGLNENTISLSYQGAFWQEGLPVFDLGVISDYFIRFPKYGYTDKNIVGNLTFSWKNTQTPDFFFYDFTGDQLKPASEFFPEYNGVKPLCGTDGEIGLKLLKKPNNDLKFISDPTKQQTVFDKINYDLPFIDNAVTNDEPSPLQLFVGYNTANEGWNKARIYLELNENINYNVTTNINLTDDLIVFKNNYVEIQNPTGSVNFLTMGFNVGQHIEFTSSDNNIDGLNLAKIANHGVLYKIKEVQLNRIYLTRNVVAEETSVIEVPKPTTPFYDNNGNKLTIFRNLSITFTVKPKVLAYFDVFGESEGEDERHRININNRNLNILKLQDAYIFKEVDINEKGIDWIFLNRKRKELIEIYPEIFNNISSYKSVIQAINFFGYNDLSFTEYFQNVDPENNKFGQLLNMELLNIFDKNVKGWQYSNLAYEQLRNDGFKKTNLFSLNYKITDNDGNFINAYSIEEVKIKLLGLKRWLTENIIPIGTKILDINGKYVMPQNFYLNHETYMTKSFKIEEYSSPVDFKVSGYLQPVSQGSNTFDISVEFFAADTIEWYEYIIKTFDLPTWLKTSTYVIGNFVYHNNNTWVCINNTNIEDEPGITSSWELSNINKIPNVQIFKDYKWDVGNTSFTINEMVDPHFIVETYWHSGYATTHKNTKSYSVVDGFFN